MTATFRSLRRAAAVAAALALAGPALAGEPPTLRSHVTVEGGLVTLGDLFDNAGAAAGTAVFRAPDPGETGTVSARRIAEAARRHGLDWSEPAAVASVSVTRASTRVPLVAIERAIAEAVRRRLGAGADTIIEIALEPRARPLDLAVQAGTAIAVARLDFNTDGGELAAEIVPRDAAAGPVRAVYRGRATEMVEIPVLRGDVARGDEIRTSDVVMRRVARRTLPRDALSDTAALAGMAARRTLRAGDAVREGDVEAPRLVQRNGTVVLVYRSPTLTLTTLGRSLDDGAEGEPVRVLNLRSRRIVEATVAGRNRAVVPAPAALRTAALAGRPTGAE